jgi:hypothetical protein
MKTQSLKRLEALDRAEANLEKMKQNLSTVVGQGKSLPRKGNSPEETRLAKESNAVRIKLIEEHIVRTGKDIQHLKKLISKIKQPKPFPTLYDN